MSAIKDLYDLFEKIYKSTSDRKTLDLMLTLKEKIIEAKEENLKLQEEKFHIQKTHEEEISILKEKINALESEIKTLKTKKIASVGVVRGLSRR